MSGTERRDPLDPAEREVADALARALPPTGPSASVDAGILAAAQAAAAARRIGGTDNAAPASPADTAATASPPRTGGGRHRGRRGPAWLRGGALAASLVVAVGVAWQLRPQYDAPGLAGEAPSPAAAESAVDATAPVPARMTEPVTDAASRTAATHPDANTAAASGRRKASAATAGEGSDDSGGQEPRTKGEKVDVDRPAAALGQAMSPLPPPPAPPAPAAPAAAPAPAPMPAATAEPPPLTLERVSAERPRARAPAATRAAEAGQRAIPARPPEAAADAAQAPAWLDQPPDDIPPASMDSPQVREAWLARIRELLAAGHDEEARASFEEFRRRHPDARIPDDLRTLLDGE